MLPHYTILFALNKEIFQALSLTMRLQQASLLHTGLLNSRMQAQKSQAVTGQLLMLKRMLRKVLLYSSNLLIQVQVTLKSRVAQRAMLKQTTTLKQHQQVLVSTIVEHGSILMIMAMQIYLYYTQATTL